MYENLFSPIKIRGLELKNRVKLPGAAVCMHKDGWMTERMINYHVAIAAGGCGLNTTEACSIHAPTAPDGVLNFSDDKFLPGMKVFCDEVHKAGGKTCLMMDQGGISTFYVQSELPVFIPSPKPDFGLEGASLEFILEVVAAFGTSAARAVKAGFDALEFHCSHGYGPHGFLSAAMNQREDEYGGSLENRARFPLECIRAIRANIPDEMPIFMRIAPFDDYAENGLTAEDVIQFCKWAKEAGCDALDVSRGNCWGHGAKYIVPPMDVPRGFNVPNAARLKKETGMISVGVGRINDPQQAEDYIASGMVDMVDMGRAQIVDHEFCNKAREGRTDEIIRCIGCLEGCFDRCIPGGDHVSCLWNPAMGQEADYALEPSQTPKKVLIVGGGVTGMEAAITLKARGNEVILAEQDSELGGIFRLAGIAPRKEETLEAVRSRAGHVFKAGVDVRLNTVVTKKLIDEIFPDVVIFSTGGAPVSPPIPGIDKNFVVGYKDVLQNKVTPKGKIVVIGGGLVGLEAAEYMYDGENEITVVEMGRSVASDAGSTRQIFIMEFLEEEEIECIVRAKAVEINDGLLIVDVKGNLRELPCDWIVVAAGSAPIPQDELIAHCQSRGITAHLAGDAKEIGFAIDAIADAAKLARQI